MNRVTPSEHFTAPLSMKPCSPFSNLPAMLAVAMIALVAVPFARAVVDDAHSFALEAAQPYVENDGVKIRYDYANGILKNEAETTVGYQVFRGNAYWFFLGSSEEKTKFDVKITDSDGKVIEGKVKKLDNAYVFEFVPERTMLIVLTISGVATDTDEFSWALVYGYKSRDAVEQATEDGEVEKESAE